MRIRYTMQLPTKKADTVMSMKKKNITAKNHDNRWSYYIRIYSTLNSRRWNAEPEWTNKTDSKHIKYTLTE